MQVVEQQLQTVQRCLGRHETHWTGAPLLVAVSGGSDSVALLWLLEELRKRRDLCTSLVVAHIDHGVHDESEAAADFVAKLAKQLGVLCERERLIDVAPSEAELRNARYEALIRMARKHGARAVLTAHHADDDIETVLFRMMRGTGPRGLAGIPELRTLAEGIVVLRPLLQTRRQTLERVIEAAALETWEDPTNRDYRYARNRLRHEVIPSLRKTVGIGLDAALVALLRTARAAGSVLDAQAQRILRACGTRVTPWRYELRCTPPDADELPFLTEALTLAYAALQNGHRPKPAIVNRILDLLHADAGQRVEGKAALLVERTRTGLLVLDPEQAGPPPETGSELPVGTTRFGATEWEVERIAHATPPLAPSPTEAGPWRALLAATHAREPWRLRTRRSGDRFWPLGANGPLDLRRFLQARGVPRFDRDRLPLVVDANDDILWIPGTEIAAPHRITVETGPCFELQARIVGGIAGGPTPY